MRNLSITRITIIVGISKRITIIDNQEKKTMLAFRLIISTGILDIDETFLLSVISVNCHLMAIVREKNMS